MAVHVLVLVLSAMVLALLALGVRLLVVMAGRSWRNGRAGRIPGPEAEKFMAGQEERLAGSPPPKQQRDSGDKL